MTDALLWELSTFGMIGLLLLLALRALRELLGIDLRPRLSPANWSRPALFAASIAILWMGAFVSYRVMTGSFAGFFGYTWERFTTAGDATHYIYIAENGYARSGDAVNKIVFYPLYPLLMAAARLLTGGRTALAGMILSQLCYGASGVAMAELAKEECAHPSAAILAYWLYPFGFFSMGVFTEGLFLLLVLLGMLMLREKKWISAGVAGLLCALTRTQGVLMILPAVYCAWRDCREMRWKWRWSYLALLGPVAGYACYLAINKIVCGSFFAYTYYQSIDPWWQTPQWLGETVVQQVHMALEHPQLALWIYWPQLALYFIGGALLLVGFRKRMRTEHLLYGTAYLGMCYTPSWLISGGRYMFGCVPMYLSIGDIERRWLRGFLLAVECVLFCTFYFWYIQGQAIM